MSFQARSNKTRLEMWIQRMYKRIIGIKKWCDLVIKQAWVFKHNKINKKNEWESLQRKTSRKQEPIIRTFVRMSWHFSGFDLSFIKYLSYILGWNGEKVKDEIRLLRNNRKKNLSDENPIAEVEEIVFRHWISKLLFVL